ncbi:androgen-dependent TFPI-regulating protein-like isoform X2 [Ostrinia nubilalis]|uniref:androgen-dependent TFPI-regulating protein-like isoform X2 n=1 Tax=Ostrinia nubilalis TaxID=29057 RepID=UPI0030824C79
MTTVDIESNSCVIYNFERNNNRKKWRLILLSVFHGGLCVCYMYLWWLGLYIYWNITEEQMMDPMVNQAVKFAACYLTNWNVSFQTVFLFLSLTYDICEWLSLHEVPRAKKIAYWRDIVFTSLVLPYTLFVSLMFWSVYWIDRELVFPKVYDSIVPWWFNHCVHTNISIVVLIETLLQARRKPVNLKLELILTTFVNVGYAVVYYSIFFFANRWLYNVFGIMTWWQVCMYQLLIWASSYVFYYMQFPINRLIHGSEPEPEKTVIERVEKEPQLEKVPEPVEETVFEKKGNGIAKNFEIAAMQNNLDTMDAPFSSDNWSLKYRSLREKFENSRL